MIEKRMIRIGRTVDLKSVLPNYTYKEELAYAIATSMIPELINYQNDIIEVESKINEIKNKIGEKKTEIEESDSDIKEIIEEISQIQSKHDKLKHNIKNLDNKVWRYFRWLFMLLFGKKWREEKEPLEKDLKSANLSLENKQEEKKDLEDLLNKRNYQLSDLEESLATLETRRTELETIPKIIDGVGSINYPFIPVTLKEARKRKGRFEPGISILIDPHSAPNKELVLPDFNIPEDKINESLKKIQSFIADVSLVSLNKDEAKEFGKIDEIVGAEKDFKDAIEILNQLANTYSPNHFNIPTIEKNSPIGKFLIEQLNKNDLGKAEDLNLDNVTTSKLENNFNIAQRINLVLKKNNAVGRQIDELIDHTKEYLLDGKDGRKGLIQATYEYRNNFKSIDEKILQNSHLNSTLIRYHFFCPKCNLSPAYIFSAYNIDIENITNLEDNSTSDLIQRLKDYQLKELDSSQGKLLDSSTKENILNTTEYAYEELLNIEKRYFTVLKEMRNGEQKTYKTRDIRRLKKIYEKIVHRLLSDPLKAYQKIDDEDDGKIKWSNQIERFNPNTKLKYDPDKKESPWSCDLCEHEFSMEQAKLGAIDKVRYDIQIPLLNTLWADENLWSKTVESLTNASKEIRDRRIQEAQALQEPINQFLADSRSIRSALQMNFAKNKASQERLIQLKDDFLKLGLVEPEDIQQLEESITESKEKIQFVDREIQNMNLKEQNMQAVPNEVIYERPIPLAPIQKTDKDLKSKLLFAFNSVDGDMIVTEERG